MLATYLTRTNQLLQYPSASPALYPSSDLTGWINEARGQVAGEAECIRVIGTLAAVIGQRNYNFSAINIGTPSVTGAQGVIHVRRITRNTSGGQQYLYPRSWPWFDLFYLSNGAAPVNGPPVRWSQYGQGSSGVGSITGIGSGTMASGSFYLDPPPDAAYTLTCDCVCYPIALAADTDVEAIPFLWTDAVPYFAAYLALSSSQSGQRIADAQRRLDQYTTFVQRARQFANPSVNRYLYSQSADPVQTAKLVAGQNRSG